MSYEKMTPEKWIGNLLSGKFESAASAKKSIAKTGWTDRTKSRARALAEQHFERPGSVKASDLVKRNGHADAESVDHVGILKHEPSAAAPLAIRSQVDMATARMMGINLVVKSCREVLETMKLAAQLYPDVDVSDGELVVDKLLRGAIGELVEEAGQVLKRKPSNGAAAKVEPIPAAPPITPHFTPEQKELFDKTKPKNPFQPPTS